MLGGHVAALPERTLAEEACDFVASDEGLYTVVDLLEALRATRRPGSRQGPRASSIETTAGSSRNPPAPLVKDLDSEMPGIAWDLLPMTQYRAHNWHCFGDLRARAVRRDLHDARLPVPLLVLLHPGAVQGRRAGARPQGRGQQLPLLEPGAGRRGDRSARRTSTASGTSSSPTRCSC